MCRVESQIICDTGFANEHAETRARGMPNAIMMTQSRRTKTAWKSSPEHGGIPPELIHKMFMQRLASIERGQYPVQELKHIKGDVATISRICESESCPFPASSDMQQIEDNSTVRSASSEGLPRSRKSSGTFKRIFLVLGLPL